MIADFNNNIEFPKDKIGISIITQTSFTKEIRLCFREGQIMKDHSSKQPIILHVLKGTIDFSVKGQSTLLKENEIIHIDANITHKLKAAEKSIARLSILNIK